MISMPILTAIPLKAGHGTPIVPFRVFRVNPGKIKWIPAFAGMTGLMNADGILHIHAACSMKFCCFASPGFSLDLT
jgi:hypothetical protein